MHGIIPGLKFITGTVESMDPKGHSGGPCMEKFLALEFLTDSQGSTDLNGYL